MEFAGHESGADLFRAGQDCRCHLSSADPRARLVLAAPLRPASARRLVNGCWCRDHRATTDPAVVAHERRRLRRIPRVRARAGVFRTEVRAGSRPGRAALPWRSPLAADPLGTASPATTRTTVVGAGRRPSPHSTTSQDTAPSPVRASPDSTSSRRADSPLSATRTPPGRSTGRHHPASVGRAATALAHTTSTPPGVPASPARARTTLQGISISINISCSQVTRRSIGSTRVIRRSGLATARTIPGSPAPDPTSTTSASAGIRGATAAQLSRCRSQIRSTSRGPMSPRWTADVLRCQAYRSASRIRSPK